MPFRIILAALIGGALAFAGGFIGHMLLGLVERQRLEIVDESGARADAKNHYPNPGVYGYPSMPKNFNSLTTEEQKKVWNDVGEEYKKGPAAMIIVPPTGEEMMDGMVLGKEGASNVVAALLAAIILSLTRPSCGFVCRWLIVVLMGVFAWVAMNVSTHIWYRFPMPWVLDELYCALIEWGLAGIAIAAIVKPRDPMAARF